MPFGAGLSQHPVPATAVGEALGALLEQVGPEPDLAVVFATTPLTGAMEDIVRTVRALLRPRVLLGSTAVSVLGQSVEVEESTAISLWAGSVGDGEPVRLVAERHDDGMTVSGFPEGIIGPRVLLLLADPFSFPIDGFLTQLARDRPDITVIGGMASAARGPGGNRLVLDDDLVAGGAVGVLLDPSRITTVVSQGCRPIGDPMIVTRSERTMVHELAGQPSLERLNAVVAQLAAGDRQLLGHGLHLGVVVDEQKAEFGRGDFLVRNVLGADRSNGAIAVGDEVPVATTVQFHLRDAASADEDLRSLLGTVDDAEGALVFTCSGRGTHLFGDPHHDAALVAEVTRGRCAGMFCAGEVGPIGGRSFLHSFTASIALFHG